MNDATIRLVSRDDYEEVFELWRKTPGIGLSARDDSKEAISRYLARNPRTCFVAAKGCGIVGVILSGHDGRRGSLRHLAVAQRAKGQGIGTGWYRQHFAPWKKRA